MFIGYLQRHLFSFYDANRTLKQGLNHGLTF